MKANDAPIKSGKAVGASFVSFMLLSPSTLGQGDGPGDGARDTGDGGGVIGITLTLCINIWNPISLTRFCEKVPLVSMSLTLAANSAAEVEFVSARFTRRSNRT